MKCLVLKENANMVLEERPIPVPGSGEVLVKIAACGVCGSDVGRIMNGGAYHYPLVPGHEFAGTVVEVGPDTDPALVGKNVAVFPLLPCMKCSECASGHYNVCKSYNYFGSRCDGGYAEYVAVPAWNLVFLPDTLSPVLAAMAAAVPFLAKNGSVTIITFRAFRVFRESRASSPEIIFVLQVNCFNASPPFLPLVFPKG